MDRDVGGSEGNVQASEARSKLLKFHALNSNMLTLELVVWSLSIKRFVNTVVMAMGV